MRHVAEAAVVKEKPIRVKNAGPSLGDHLKKQNIFFYISALCSVALIALLFLPWIAADAEGKREATSILGIILKSTKNIELLVFLIPLTLGIIGTHIAYLISLLRPGHDAFYPGTAMILMAGVELFLIVFATDSVFQLITSAEDTDRFLSFIGASEWTWIPVIWFVLALLQKWLFAKLAHKKKKTS